jgi:hypothetical protein
MKLGGRLPLDLARWMVPRAAIGGNADNARGEKDACERDAYGQGYSARNAIVGSMLSARCVGTTQPSMQTPSMTIP